MIYIFSVCALYNGVLHIHFVEEIFVLMAVSLGSFVAVLSRHKATVLAAVFVLSLAIWNNYGWYNKEVLGAKRELETHHKICKIIKDNGDKEVVVIINNKKNPEFINFICQRFYDIKTSDVANSRYNFETNFRDNFRWVRLLE